MIWLIIALIGAIMGMLNALMDTLETEISFGASIFNGKKDKTLWCKPISAHKVKFLPFTRYRPDPWHLAKSGIILYGGILSAIMYIFQPRIPVDNPVIGGLIVFVGWGLVWNGSFNFFYNKVFKAKHLRK
jgi:hypothetical protein